MSISSKYLMHTSMPKMSPIPTQRGDEWVPVNVSNDGVGLIWWMGSNININAWRNYKPRSTLAFHCKIDDEVINKFLAHFTFADVIRMPAEMRASQPSLDMRNSAKWLLYPHAYCGGLSFISASIPLFLLASSIFFSSAQIYFWGSISPWKMWACNTLLWLSGRRVVIAVVVIVPFSIHFRASFWGAAAILHVCIFLCIRTFLWERRKKVGHVLFMHLGFLSFGRVVRSLSFPDPYIGLGQLQNGCC